MTTTTETYPPLAVKQKVEVDSSSEVFAFPVSSGQQRLWFLEQFHPGTPLYNSPVAVRIDGPLDIPVLERTLNYIVQRHEILRTRFDLQGGQPVQVVAASMPLHLAVADLSSLPGPDREREARRAANEEAQRPFDLSRLPLLRVKLLRLSDAEHIFVLTAHHIIFDGWSLTLFFRELATIYQRLRAGKEPAMPDPPIQYADFAVWQREQRKSLEKELAWWKKQLSGSLPTLELPIDRPRPAVQTYRGAVASLSLPATLRDALQELSRNEGATLFMTLLAAFQTLLHRYTGQEDILVGSPVAGRSLKETEEVIGLFINTLVLRGDLSGNPTFREVLGRTREMAINAYANEEVPFERLVEDLQPNRSLSHPPLFQVMFALDRGSLESVNWPGLKLTQLELDSGTAKFDLTVYMTEGAERLTARMEYNTDLFDAPTIQRMLAHFTVLLEGIAADPNRRLSELPLLTSPERNQLLVEWNETQADYPTEKTVLELIEAQVALTPDAVAIVFGEQRMTYRELDNGANQVARHLRRLGVRPDTLVGVCLDRSPSMVVGVLGVLKAGGAYVPIDPTYPAERLAFMVEDSKVTLVVTQRSLLEALPGGTRCLCLDSEWKSVAREKKEKPNVTVNPENLAYVIYTSGSTGKPKGVQIPHRAVVNFLNSMRREPGLTGADTLLAVTTLSFDIAALELYLPLTVGARIVLATREEAADGAQLAFRISEANVTVMQATPATWRLLLDSGWSGSQSLRIFCGGEALSRELANRLCERCTELWNLYGPTETTIWSAAARIERGNSPVVIGRPIANTQLYILDRQLQPVPAGVPGELFIGGAGLARGYLNRPELTAEKFIRHPFSDDPEARLYRTGDLARRFSDGGVELLGRMDHQVKIRGFRIEPGEIEAVLLQFPKVREAVVVAREDAAAGKKLIAYLTTYRQTTASLNELRRFLREKLPGYMVPAAFVVLDKLPLTPNGKVDRRALPAPEHDRLKSDTAFVAPRVGLEQTVAAVWEEVLSLKNPGVDDNFFDLGGHSLQVVQVQNKLRERLDVELPVIKLFEYPTIRSLAGCLGEEKKEKPLAHKIQERTQRQRASADHKLFGARVKL
jgi:amino acid adenylation domain-containing protein